MRHWAAPKAQPLLLPRLLLKDQPGFSTRLQSIWGDRERQGMMEGGCSR